MYDTIHIQIEIIKFGNLKFCIQLFDSTSKITNAGALEAFQQLLSTDRPNETPLGATQFISKCKTFPHNTCVPQLLTSNLLSRLLEMCSWGWCSLLPNVLHFDINCDAHKKVASGLFVQSIYMMIPVWLENASICATLTCLTSTLTMSYFMSDQERRYGEFKIT